MCPGKEYARIEVLVFLHKVVKRFKWEAVFPNEKITVDPVFAFRRITNFKNHTAISLPRHIQSTFSTTFLPLYVQLLTLWNIQIMNLYLCYIDLYFLLYLVIGL